MLKAKMVDEAPEMLYTQLKAYVGRAVKQRCKKHGCKFNATAESVIAAMAFTRHLAEPKSYVVKADWSDAWFCQAGNLTRFDVVETITGILSRKAATLEEAASRCYQGGPRYREYVELSKVCSIMISCLAANRDDFNDYVAKLEKEREEISNAKQKEQQGNGRNSIQGT